jgi:hypothetical protein
MDITSCVGSRESGAPSIEVDHCYLVNLDHDPPPGKVWFEQEYAQLTQADPNCQAPIARAARQLEAKMDAAVRRRQVDKLWTTKSIENKLRKRGWKRTRSLKRVAGSSAKSSQQKHRARPTKSRGTSNRLAKTDGSG